MALTLPQITARNLPLVIDAFAYYEGDVEEGLEKLLEATQEQAQNLLEAARLLGMTDGAGQLSEIAKLIEHATVVDRRALLRHYVEIFEPFFHWKRRIAQGFDPTEAARQTKVIFDITNTAAETRDWMLDVGMVSGAIQEEGINVTPVSGKAVDLGSVIADILNRTESATASLESYVGPAVWAKIPEPAREHLTRAASRLSENAPADEVVRAVGLGLDAYLSDFGEQAVGGYADQTMTMGATINKLVEDGLIVSKQRQVLGYITAMRNAAEHPDTDGDIQPGSWSLNPKSAQSCLRVALDAIRSIDARSEGRFEL